MTHIADPATAEILPSSVVETYIGSVVELVCGELFERMQ
jgi:hypothetical protein